MIYHQVWFKLREESSDADRQRIEEGLNALPAQIPEIVELRVGPDFSGRSRGFELGLLVLFQTREDGQIYDRHPAHQKFIAENKEAWSEVMALDFEA